MNFLQTLQEALFIEVNPKKKSQQTTLSYRFHVCTSKEKEHSWLFESIPVVTSVICSLTHL